MEVATAVTLGTIASSIFYTKKNTDVQKKQYKSNQAAVEREYELKQKQAKNALSEEQRKNRSLLAKQQSAYKAKLGASGISAQKGSGQAALDTMRREHDIEDKYLVDQANISLEALLNGINQTSSRNLLSLNSLSQKTANTAFGDWGNGISSASRSLIK